MNLLAHLHLGTELSPLAAAGNLLADFSTNQQSGAFSEGIRFHRQIDGFTDSHPETLKIRPIFGPGLRRYSGILIDLAFDYFLALHWDMFAPIPRRDFINRELARMSDQSAFLTEEDRELLLRIEEEEWLESYTTIDGLAHTLRRLAIRRPVAKPLIGAESLIQKQAPALEDAFLSYYPHLERAARSWR